MNLDKFTGCLMGVAIGDALGMPLEKMTTGEIHEVLNKEGEKFLPASISSRPFHSTSHLGPGCWTDDTQLTLATMEAIIAAGGKFDMDEIAKQHLLAFDGERRGWGKATTNACQRLKDGIHWSVSGQPGWGNGVMMKIAPLGLRKAVRNINPLGFISNCIDFAQMTHLLTPAIVSGIIHAWTIAELALIEKPELFSARTLLDLLYERAKYLEVLLSHNSTDSIFNTISNQLNWLITLVRKSYLVGGKPRWLGTSFKSDESLAFSAYWSFGLSYAMFLRNPHSFDTVFDTLRAGGDTDSNAAIVASLLGALHGTKIIPTHLLEEVERGEEIQQRIKKFHEIVSGS